MATIMVIVTVTCVYVQDLRLNTSTRGAARSFQQRSINIPRIQIYWVIFNEVRLADTADNIFAISFGQVLATFVVLDPLWQVIKMSPGAVDWFKDLTIMRWATGRPKHGPTQLLNTQLEHEEMVSLNHWNK
ncbi:hypothetical protein R3P38DRAFT_3206309 [Favolaschia claudopus]|uniref:Uncharacterized protein n=1 Tax=Favolaschia claudopus TaxID=2862362 RepID=A0AAW0ALK1_9AGAR